MRLQLINSLGLLLYIPDPKLLPDFFLDESPGSHGLATLSSAGGAATPAAPAAPAAEKPSGSSTIADPELAKTFSAVQSLINADLVKGVNAVYVFDLKGKYRRRICGIN